MTDARRAIEADDRVRRVIERIRAIPKGFVRTYGDIDPAAPRFVGHVLATTDDDVPWHRVVRSDGSVAKGRRQLDLLRREGVPIRGGRVLLREARLDPSGLLSSPRSGRSGQIDPSSRFAR